MTLKPQKVNSLPKINFPIEKIGMKKKSRNDNNKNSENRTENKHRKSSKESFVTGTSCVLFLVVPGFHSFLQNTRERDAA